MFNNKKIKELEKEIKHLKSDRDFNIEMISKNKGKLTLLMEYLGVEVEYKEGWGIRGQEESISWITDAWNNGLRIYQTKDQDNNVVDKIMEELHQNPGLESINMKFTELREILNKYLT